MKTQKYFVIDESTGQIIKICNEIVQKPIKN